MKGRAGGRGRLPRRPWEARLALSTEHHANLGGDLRGFLEGLGRQFRVGARVAHVQEIPPRRAAYEVADPPLAEPVARALKGLGLERLYSHQAQALALARAGRDLVAATPTASGKSLVYALPVMEDLWLRPGGHTLMLFPLKALERDQADSLNRLGFAVGLGQPASIYDGDTPPGQRKRLRENPPPILISNPDMVHAGICAYPQAWESFLAGLRYIVIDEVHTYRGVFGSHVAQLLKRLLRLCASRGARPQFILCSATIANPAEHAARLTGREFAPDQVVDTCGAPAAGRQMVLLNPEGAASTTAAMLMSQAVRQGLATICFTKSRLHTELIHQWVSSGNPDLQGAIAGYRAGFLPEERRQIERGLATGQLAGVVTTSALEMGIDIGGLDVCILVGYPGSQINTWQRGGRVGRAGRDSAVFLVAGPDALDQYFIKHPEQLLARPVEAAVLDPDNPVIVEQHLICAAAEEPLQAQGDTFDLERHRAVVQGLVARGELLADASGQRYFSPRKRPQRQIDLRGAGHSYAVLDPGGRVIGTLDGIRVFKEGYPGAVYLHRTRSYLVDQLDTKQHQVRVQPCKVAYYTRAMAMKQTEIIREVARRPVANFLVRHGDLLVTETVHGYERRRISGGDLLGQYALDLEPLTFETQGFWMDIEEPVRQLVERAGHHFMGSIHALEHTAIAMFPLFALCERSDIGGISIPLHPQTNKAGVFIYDGAAGGVGLARQGFQMVEELLAAVEEVLANCECEDGCPACVYSAKCGNGNKPLDKAGALYLTRILLGKVDFNQPVALPAPPPPLPLAAPRRRSQDEPLAYGVLDLETQRLAGEVGGWQNAHLMKISVAVLYDSREDRFIAYREAQVPELLARLEQLRMIVGFNILGFDYHVMSAYSPRDFAGLPTLDLLVDVKQVLRHRLSLDALAQATLGAPKSADGLQAVEWWRAGRMEELTSYCQKDVELTRDLFLHGQREGHLLFRNKQDALLQVPVDWQWTSLRRRFNPA